MTLPQLTLESSPRNGGPSGSSRSSIGLQRDDARSQRYWLRPWIYACPTHDGAVVLNLESDAYLGLTAEQAWALHTKVVDWPAPTGEYTENGTVTEAQAQLFADACVTSGLLTRDSVTGRSAAPIVLTSSQTLSALGCELSTAKRLGSRAPARFLAATASAFWMLRVRSLKSAVSVVRQRKCTRASASFDVASMTKRVQEYRRLRSYFYTAKGHCLFHALALINYLSYYDLFPTWVIGVRSHPFGAHSWVQHERWVLDATPEQVCYYTPILAI